VYPVISAMRRSPSIDTEAMFCHLRRREGVSESRMDYTSWEDFDQPALVAEYRGVRRAATERPRLGELPRT
jgi:hypothetical protein